MKLLFSHRESKCCSHISKQSVVPTSANKVQNSNDTAVLPSVVKQLVSHQQSYCYSYINNETAVRTSGINMLFSHQQSNCLAGILRQCVQISQNPLESN
ncbi:hypothetical protein CEXT_564131 [Caerostris extrusa]|uniref:Uncharacterized protein n=1 Tax=Caerostris extrusa TaxID=172846 RepID=A0AAV4XKT5_CAEEX|nr:hypothetical protein CEXT_564131 [Caerostris extrusa]